VGIRAQGMAGAFVAVADDASATWWNPAGLAHGAFANLIVEGSALQEPRVEQAPGGLAAPAWGSNSWGVSFGYPALGLSYYRLRISEIRAIEPTATTSVSRQDQGPASVLERSLVVNQWGVTVGQSLGDHVVVATTVKMLYGGLGSAVVSATGASLDSAAALSGDGQAHATLDLGAMATFGQVQLGFVLRNVAEPTFTNATDSETLTRQARVGAAFVGERVTAAFDADLARVPTALGDERHVSGGVEARFLNRRLAARGGVSVNTTGSARPAVAGGVSVGLRSSLFLDGQVTGGADEARRGWGIDLRVTF